MVQYSDAVFGEGKEHTHQVAKVMSKKVGVRILYLRQSLRKTSCKDFSNKTSSQYY